MPRIRVILEEWDFLGPVPTGRKATRELESPAVPRVDEELFVGGKACDIDTVVHQMDTHPIIPVIIAKYSGPFAVNMAEFGWNIDGDTGQYAHHVLFNRMINIPLENVLNKEK